jgi:allantoinase
MSYDLLLKNGTLATDYGVFKADVGVTDGKIIFLGNFDQISSVEAREIVDLRGKYLLPGGVDPHCHFGEPGTAEREDFGTGTRSAAAGGVTTIIEMPLCFPPTDNPEHFYVKLNLAKEKAVVDFSLWGGLVPHNQDDLPKLSELGVRAFKAFMCYTSHYPQVTDGELLQGMKVIASQGGLVGVHAENDGIIKYCTERLKKAGRIHGKAHAEARPPIAEYEAISRAMLLAREADVDLHILHMSIASGAQLIHEAKQSGVRVTFETCPHYLTLTDEHLDQLGPYAKCNPPLRSKENVEALWDYVLNGTLDMIVSDHAPYTIESKEKGWQEIFAAPSGIAGIQTMLPLLFDEGVHKRGLSLTRLVQLISTNPAKRFKLYPQKGTLRVGSDADLVVIDLNAEWAVKKEDLFYKNFWSPYEGWTLKGKVLATFVRGRKVFEGGKILAEPGYGKWVAMGEN